MGWLWGKNMRDSHCFFSKDSLDQLIQHCLFLYLFILRLCPRDPEFLDERCMSLKRVAHFRFLNYIHDECGTAAHDQPSPGVHEPLQMRWKSIVLSIVVIIVFFLTREC
jgi:hypothetical protein